MYVIKWKLRHTPKNMLKPKYFPMIVCLILTVNTERTGKRDYTFKFSQPSVLKEVKIPRNCSVEDT